MIQYKMPKSALDSAAAKLREIVFMAEDGALIGKEEDLVVRLAVSRTTVRQVARLLEREGLLRVRRGSSGGYYAARPDIHTIEASVSSYLEMTRTKASDVTAVASVLWVEVLRRAAELRTEQSASIATRFLEEVRGLKPDASFSEVYRIEQESRQAIFDLIDVPYIELIFKVNIAFGNRRHFYPQTRLDDTEKHREFIQIWRHGKLLELESIVYGNPELAMMAARHTRNIWEHRLGLGDENSSKTKG